MSYLVEREAAYEHPDSVLCGVRSLLMLGMHYRTADPLPGPTGSGRISRYAWGPRDYHDVLHEGLRRLVRWLRDRFPQARARGVVDTAPLLEREFAQLAGLGWIGKNTLLLTRTAGSYFFLAALLTDLELAYDAAHEADHCGTCTACLDACPTSAFPQPYVLDATRCISYLTIELKGSVPVAQREGLGEWLFGCDICQEVCPWNGRAPRVSRPEFQPADPANPVDLGALFALSEPAFRDRFRRTPLWRARRRGLLRNAAIVLGGRRNNEALAPLRLGLRDAESLVRGASAWALGRLPSPAAADALRQQLALETDTDVRHEIQTALAADQ
jgi:epoxyqueuosine reductase